VKPILRMLLLLILIPVLLLLSCQSRLIYYPARYEPNDFNALQAAGGQRLEYNTGQGRQVAYYVPSAASSATNGRIWVCFGGNAALALHWLYFTRQWDPSFGYLLVDYPGYGECEGAPNPARIRANALAAVEALAQSVGTSTEALRPRLGVLGQSIGGAAALMAAEDLQARRVVLLSPFTTLTEMGKRVVGWPLCHLNLHRFNNRKQLARVCAQGARVTILHGTDDRVIPIRMSRELAAAHPDCVTLHELPGLDHNDLVLGAGKEVGAALKRMAD
jgi:pimeloyl-ACP methyl ester carboxylesterase